MRILFKLTVACSWISGSTPPLHEMCPPHVPADILSSGESDAEEWNLSKGFMRGVHNMGDTDLQDVLTSDSFKSVREELSESEFYMQ